MLELGVFGIHAVGHANPAIIGGLIDRAGFEQRLYQTTEFLVAVLDADENEADSCIGHLGLTIGNGLKRRLAISGRDRDDAPVLLVERSWCFLRVGYQFLDFRGCHNVGRVKIIGRGAAFDDGEGVGHS